MLDPPNLGIWFWVLRLAPLLASVGAVMLARRRREYAPVAVFLCWVLLSHVVRPLIRIYIGAGPAGGVPYAGLPRAAFHVEQALFVSWPIGITALAIHVLAKRRAWPIGLAYVAIAVSMEHTSARKACVSLVESSGATRNVTIGKVAPGGSRESFGQRAIQLRMADRAKRGSASAAMVCWAASDYARSGFERVPRSKLSRPMTSRRRAYPRARRPGVNGGVAMPRGTAR